MLSGSLKCFGASRSKGMETDEAIRAFLSGSGGARPGNEAGPSAADLRELRSLSLSFSLMGPPIGVSLPDSDLADLRCFLQGKSIPSPKVRQRHIPCRQLQQSPLQAATDAYILPMEADWLHSTDLASGSLPLRNLCKLMGSELSDAVLRQGHYMHQPGCIVTLSFLPEG